MPFVFPHRQTIAKMYAGLYPNSDPNMVTDLQLLQMRKQMIEASRIYPFKDKFEENFQKVFNFGAPDDEQPFWKLFYAMKDEYDLERFLRLVVPHAVMDATVILEFMNKNMIQEFDVLHDLIAFQQRILVGSAHSPHSRHSSRLVNTFSDSLLSRDFEGRIVVTVEPFNWREIIKVLLDAGGIVKAVDEGENALRRFLPGAEPADGVYQLLLED